MFNLISQIETFLRGMWRFNWWAVGLSWLVFVVGTILVFWLPNQYQSSASFYVKDNSVLEPILKGITVQSNVEKHAYVLSEAIKSRSIMEELILESGLSERLKDEDDMQDMVGYLQKNIKITTERSTLYDVEFIYDDPQIAFEVVDILLNQFLNKVLSGKLSDARVAEVFLEKQIAEYEHRLTSAENKLADFKKEHIEQMPANNRDYVFSLQEAQTELAAASVQLQISLEKRNELRRQLSGDIPSVGLVGFNSPTQAITSPLTSQIEAVRNQLNQDLLKYTENHPKVLASLATIESLEKQLFEEKRSPTKASTSSNTARLNAANPVYQSAQIGLRRAETEVATNRAIVNEHRRQVAMLRDSLDGVSEVEAELSKLNRDYDITKTQFLELTRRLELARLSQEAERDNESIKFQIIDPPIVPKASIGPNRPLFITAVLIISIIIGAGFALFLDQAKPVFLTTHHLNRETSLPVYGSVSMRVSDQGMRTERTTLAAFVLLVVLLLGFYSISIVKHEEGASIISSYVDM
ncbi:MAG: Wzz/FepE/Etk N-terminal domain-containing protein [Gammaproteobacteria bacterium]|nr:Wzz/FepE/Etk N-terminal domain-containing protein [Gammaproteobacteria bacterium]